MSKIKTLISFIENSFIEDHTFERFEKCCSIEKVEYIIEPIDKPNYIKQFLVNDRIVVNFLGYLADEDTLCENLEGKYLEFKTMVIPKDSTFIDVSDLRAYLGENPGSKEIIPVEQLTRSKKIGKNIQLKVCVGVHDKEERWFHICLNYSNSLKFGGRATCDWQNSEIYFNSKNQLQYDLLPFYISWEDIIKEDNEPDEVLGLEERLREYFEYYGKNLENPDINCINNDIDGVFLLPRLQVDQNVIYTCLLNQPSADDEHSIQEKLQEWFDAYDDFNKEPENQELIIKGNDLFLCNIEQWSIKIGCDATLDIIKNKRREAPES